MDTLYHKIRRALRAFLCNKMDWHTPDWPTKPLYTRHCKYCGRYILQDSNGDWFSAHRYGYFPRDEE